MKFLVIRFSSLGDIITTTAFLKTLKNLYPKSSICYATKEEFAELLEKQPFLDKVISLKKGESILHFAKKLNDRFDCIFDLHKNLRSYVLSFLIKAKSIKRVDKHTLYRYKLMHRKLFFFVKDRQNTYNIDDQIKLISQTNENIKSILFVDKADISAKKTIIGIAPGAKWQTKRWPKEYFKRLIGLIQEKINCDIFIFGSKEEVNIANYIKNGYKNVMNFAGTSSIKETASYMANCSIVVSNDSALMHMAAALDIPVVALFGPTVKEFGFYPKNKSIILEKDLSCRPCSLHGNSKCPKGHHKCLKDIEPYEVLNSIKILMEAKQ